jgi:hypothetical protein
LTDPKIAAYEKVQAIKEMTRTLFPFSLKGQLSRKIKLTHAIKAILGDMEHKSALRERQIFPPGMGSMSTHCSKALVLITQSAPVKRANGYSMFRVKCKHSKFCTMEVTKSSSLLT